MLLVAEQSRRALTRCQLFSGNGPPIDPTYTEGDTTGRLFVEHSQDFDTFMIYDWVQGVETHIKMARLSRHNFSIGKWFAERCDFASPWERAHE